jgi:hypothetical protein
LPLPASPVVAAAAPAAPARLERVRLLDVSGAEVTQVASDARLDLVIEWKAESGTPLAITVELASEQGAPLFSTTVDAGRSSSTGSARLSISRLGLGEGQYQVATSVHAPNALGSETLKSALTVTAHAPGGGVVRPPHVWSLDVGSGAQAKSS